jgi:murein DD-endopeptidase MepM/ murein hydrolase activator NlpD
MSKPGNKSLFISLGLILLALGVLSSRFPVQAAPVAQLTVFPTPTPGPDGRIIYIVQPNDSLWRISAITGVSIDQLRALNHLEANSTLNPGDKLLIGMAGPVDVTSTPGPSPTPVPKIPTLTPKPGWGILCVLLYNDQNGDSLRQETEMAIPGGAINISNRGGTVSRTADTQSGSDPVCFDQLPEGDFNISVAVPQGYNSTTVMNRTVALKAGDKTYLAFGAQPNSEKAIETQVVPETPQKSLLLGILGGAVLLVGVGLGLYATLLRKAGG